MTADGTGRVMVIGIGNPDRGDDGAGRAVARRLKGTLPPDVAIVEHDGEAASLVALLDGATAVYLADACVSGSPVGTVRRIDAVADKLPADGFATSTHGLGLAEAIELARALGQLPSRCVVIAIEAATAAPGIGLSPPVAAAVEVAAETLRDEILSGNGETAGSPRSRP